VLIRRMLRITAQTSASRENSRIELRSSELAPHWTNSATGRSERHRN
jgi:hypothetical protein